MSVSGNRGDLSIESALEIGPDLDAEFRRMPGLMYRWGELEAVALGVALQAKMFMEQSQAETYRRLRETSLKSSDKVNKLTEAALEAMVELDPEFRSYRAKYIEAEVNSRKMRAAAFGLMAKRDMLIQLGYGQQSQHRAGVDSVPAPRKTR